MKAYQIKVTIKGSKPPVWRRMIIPAGITFEEFSAILNEAMEWSGCHLYSFTFVKMGVRFEKIMDNWIMGGLETLDSREYVIDMFLEGQKSFTYVYDFGDDWVHTINVEEVLEDYDKDYAQVIKFKGNSFPEDCGGIWGYYELMEALEDSTAPEYEDALEWYEMMCPEEYDMDVVNESLYNLGTGSTMEPPENADVLLVVDMQNDFIDGVLGTEEAKAIVPKVDKKIEEFEGLVLFTQDTHEEDYLETQEGKKLPIPHCIYGSKGWEIHPSIAKWIENEDYVIAKPAFGSVELAGMLSMMDEKIKIRSITLVGLCTDICVISNAMLLKNFMPEAEIIVDASCCAGVTPQSHETALQAMKACQIEIKE